MTLLEAFQTRPDRLYFARLASECFLGKRNLLEIGCGRGDAALYFHEQGYRVTAVDIENKDFFPKNVEYILADAATLPFKDESYDCVYCEASFSSVKDKNSAAKEIHRVLRPGGRLAICDYVLKDRSVESIALVPSLNGACTEAEYISLFNKLSLIEIRDESAFLVCLIMHLCYTYALGYDELLKLIGAERAKYGFKTFMFTKQGGIDSGN